MTTAEITLRPTTAPAAWAPARWFFRGVARRRIAGALDGLHVAGLEAARERLARGPVIFAATHVAWWDPLVVLVLDEALGGEGRALMDAANLRRLPFFRWLGAVPLDRSAPARARGGLREAVRWLDGPGHAVWIFPQGRQRPAHLRPLGLERGIEALARASGAEIVPVALSYGFRDGERPAAVVDLGAPLPPGPVDLAALELRLVAGLARIDQFLDRGDPRFDALVPAPRGAADVDLPTRALAQLARWFP